MQVETKLTQAERLILLNQYRILSVVDADNENKYSGAGAQTDEMSIKMFAVC